MRANHSLFNNLSLLFITLVLGYIFFMPKTVSAASCSAADIVLSEISYDDGVGTATDEDEFFEIYLPNPVAAGDFDNCVIQHLNQDPTVQYTLDLSTLDDSGIAAGTYLLFGSINVADTDATLNGTCATNCLQNGIDDGLVLIDSSQPAGSQGVWYYTWEDGDGSMAAYEGVTPVNIGTDSSAACGTSTEESSLSQPLNPPTASDAAAGNFTAGSCVSPGTSNRTPTAVTLSEQTAENDRPSWLLPLLLAIKLLVITGVFLWIRHSAMQPVE